MASPHRGKSDSEVRPPDADDALVFPAEAEPSDETPTLISRNAPTVEPKSSQKHKVTEVLHRPIASVGSETLINSLRGQRLAHFELIEPIGVGGMAAVIRARDTQLDRFVALKILPPDMAKDAENVKRFHQEAKAAAKLDHENIARVFFCGEDQGLYFIAFEFVAGENLRVVLELRGRLPVAEAVHYLLQIATGLEHAASCGVVHRDIKPSNIIIGPGRRAKLVDMGLARNIERKAEDLTQSGVTLGTFDYISPEQALEPREADTRSDIYSLGCTFYHMLTGQAPVPEGTAAKKVHHHQHVPPTDPRQLNPAVPDEIALILGKMMAKKPAERYERPIHLVQHLMQVARKVGAVDDVPEGVRFVDTPLPGSPRSRPALMVGMAVLLLGILFALIALTPPDPETPTLRPVLPNPQGAAKVVNPPEKASGPPEVGSAAPSDRVIRTAEQFANLLKDKERGANHQAKLEGTIDLGETPLVFQGLPGQALTLESVGSRATLQLNVLASPAATAALAVEGGSLTLRKLKIELHGAGSKLPEQLFAAIAVRGTAQVLFEDCIFVQLATPAVDASPMSLATVSVESTTPGAQVTFNECYFHGEDKDQLNVANAQAAVAIDGPADIKAFNCAFKAHVAIFHLRPACRLKETNVRLLHCAAFVVNGPVFRLEEKASATLEVNDSLFSRPNDSVGQVFEPNLIHQAGQTPILFRGQHNGYHHLNAFWSSDSDIYASLADVRDELKAAGTSDLQSVHAKTNPWQEAQPLNASPPWTAFQTNTDFLGFGLTKWLGTKMPEPPDMVAAVARNENVKIVDPDYRGKAANVFTTLEQALSRAKSRDVLLLKPGKSGPEIEIKPALLEPGLELTLKPYHDTQPVLVLGKSIERKETAFFRLLDGKLHFEHLHFVLEPKQDGATSQSVVLLGETASCAFTKCIVTMKPGRRIPLHVVALINPADLMKMPRPSAPNGRVQFTNSFARGEGDLIHMQSCRLVDLVVDNSLIALTGSLLSVQGAGDETPMDQGVKMKLSHVSAFTKDAIFSLRSSPAGKGLTKTHVEAKDCLLAALDARPMVYLKTSGVTTEEHLRKYLNWQAEHNCYVNFDKLLNQERPDESTSAMQLVGPEWERFSAETSSRHEQLLFPLIASDLWQALPNMFKPADSETQVAGFGADLDALPKLAPVVKAEE